MDESNAIEDPSILVMTSPINSELNGYQSISGDAPRLRPANHEKSSRAFLYPARTSFIGSIKQPDRFINDGVAYAFTNTTITTTTRAQEIGCGEQ